MSVYYRRGEEFMPDISPDKQETYTVVDCIGSNHEHGNSYIQLLVVKDSRDGLHFAASSLYQDFIVDGYDKVEQSITMIEMLSFEGNGFSVFAGAIPLVRKVDVDLSNYMLSWLSDYYSNCEHYYRQTVIEFDE